MAAARLQEFFEGLSVDELYGLRVSASEPLAGKRRLKLLLKCKKLVDIVNTMKYIELDIYSGVWGGTDKQRSEWKADVKSARKMIELIDSTTTRAGLDKLEDEVSERCNALCASLYTTSVRAGEALAFAYGISVLARHRSEKLAAARAAAAAPTGSTTGPLPPVDPPSGWDGECPRSSGRIMEEVP